MPEDEHRKPAETVDEVVVVERVEASEPPPRPFPAFNPVSLLLFLILALVVVLVALGIRRGEGGAPAADDPAVAALKADLDARRAELNRQRLALGLPPLEGPSEPIEEIAARLKQDADRLVAVAGKFQDMLAAKDAELSARNAEILSAETAKKSLAAESATLRSELRKALAEGSGTDLLERELADVKAQRDTLAGDLQLARDQLAQSASAVSIEEFRDLERRYQETLRAKEFFEKRTAELEAAPEDESVPEEP